PYLAGGLDHEINPFALINTFCFMEGVFLYLPAGTCLENPLHLFWVGTSGAKGFEVFHPRILIVLGHGAKARIIVHDEGSGSSACFTNTVGEIYLGENAQLEFCKLQRKGAGIYDFFTTRYLLARASYLQTVTFSQGGAMIRDEENVEFNGEGGFADLKALSVLENKSQVFHHIAIHHKVPQCTSRQLYKNILAGKAQAEYNSVVHVWQGAQHSDASQLDRNLLISDSARVWSRPQLKIDADDVRCSHGATNGKLDPDELFYLQTRGLDSGSARFLMMSGFAQEVLDGIRPEAVRARYEAYAQDGIRSMIRHAESAYAKVEPNG
ncbi:MAG: Fe-S cluster assembly protein SufD, partial [Candidatus Omnitrophica bacterium]|nr:Fe-S cluster assembly protein SufD [Candidatus Omnitrophota bacterium]